MPIDATSTLEHGGDAIRFPLDSAHRSALSFRAGLRWRGLDVGIATMARASDVFTVPAGHGTALVLAVELVNIFGTQAVDTWAFCVSGPTEFLSMEHTRSRLSRTIPRVGDTLFTTQRREFLTLTGDTSPGIHDSLLCACSPELYRELGCADGHRSCQGNLHEALASVGIAIGQTPAPLNLFMNVAVGSGGEVIRRDARSGRQEDRWHRNRLDSSRIRYLELRAADDDRARISEPEPERFRPPAIISLPGTDARLWRGLGIPAFVYGITPFNVAMADEYVDIEEVFHVLKTHTLSAFGYLMAGAPA